MLTIKLTVILIVVFSLTEFVFAQQQDIGVFYQNENNCRVKQDEIWTQCKKGLMVAEGDFIETTRDATALGIQWIAPPHTHGEKIAPNQYKAVFTRPAGKRSMVSSISSILGFGRKSGHEGQYLVTRGDALSAVEKMQLPGHMATLLPGAPVTLSWCNRPARKLVITDQKGGAPVFSQDITGKRSITVTPEAMGIRSGVLYSWAVEGDKAPSGQLLLLNKESAAEIVDGLNDIGKTATNESDKILQQAAYLNFLSETYPDEISLYWRSIELLAKLGAEMGDKALVEKLSAEARDKMACKEPGY